MRLFDPSLDRADRIQLVASYAMQVMILGALFYALFEKEWLTAFLALGAFAVTLVPAYLRRSLRVYLPLEFDFVLIWFIFASLILGEVRSYYERFWWWDLALHTSAGMVNGMVGFALVFILNRHEQVAVALSPIFVAIFSFCFAQAIGVIWEVFEFTMDGLFGMNMQKSGLVDTMSDLIVNTIGAAVVSIGGYSYARGNELLMFDRILRRFLERNRLGL
ncbi:MAG TPA: hypothetical protein VF190_02060 [Rhodothermales bacterium]